MSCHRCGHLLKLITDRPTLLPNSYITSKGAVVNLLESTKELIEQTYKTETQNDGDDGVFSTNKKKI